MREDSPHLPWHVAGAYFESCNCEAVCPCRMVGGVPGGRSTHGVCLGALSWQILDGAAGKVDLSGLAAALVLRYDDDEPGSPWTFILHVDERGDDRQREALEAIFLGRLGGEHVLALPWVKKASNLLDVRASRIDIEHTASGHALRVGDSVALRASRPVETDKRVSCVISGHHQAGTELYADELKVQDDPLTWDLAGNCAFVSEFDYSSSR
jgi:hypothetical protein